MTSEPRSCSWQPTYTLRFTLHIWNYDRSFNDHCTSMCIAAFFLSCRQTISPEKGYTSTI